jgi:nucleotide-binding universal stress UspA family protein
MRRFKNILCVLTVTSQDRDAIERAVTLAQNNQARLTIVGVMERISLGMGMPDGGPISSQLQSVMLESCQQSLERLVAPYRGRVDFDARVLVGVQFVEVIREVLRSRHDLLIKVAENPEWLDRLLGSEDMHLLRKCPCPVWLIKPSSPKTYRRILATVDLGFAYPPEEMEARGALNRHVFELASSLAHAENAELHVVHAWEAAGESAMRGGLMRIGTAQVDAYVEEVKQICVASMSKFLHECSDAPASTLPDRPKPVEHLLKGSARKVIPALVRSVKADLVVMGTVARTGIPGYFMGNTAELILSQIDCAVLAVKPAGFATPVTL